MNILRLGSRRVGILNNKVLWIIVDEPGSG
jgi:hypothetical protein